MSYQVRMVVGAIAAGIALAGTGVAAADAQDTGTTFWALDRIDQRDSALDNSFNPSGDGSGVAVYVLDTGLRSTHTEFAGRVGKGFDHAGAEDISDCHGHGTMAASAAVGSQAGVAKGATVIPVRGSCDVATQGTNAPPPAVADGTEPDSTRVSEAIDRIVEDVKRQEKISHRPAVINLSMRDDAVANKDGSLVVGPMAKAVQRAIDANITVVAAAGNQGRDACTIHPVTVVPDAIVVGNTTKSDKRSPGSNYGSCVTLFAPGTWVTMASHKTDTTFLHRSGTSFAAPIVAGAAAIYLQQHPNATPAEVKQALIDASTKDVIKDVGAGSPNRLLYVAPSTK